MSLLTTVLEEPKGYGRIIRDDKGNVGSIVEDKDASDEDKKIQEINTAIYCLEWRTVAPGVAALTNNNRQKEYYLTDLIGWAVKNKLLVSGSITNDWREVVGLNSRLELAEAMRLMNERTLKNLAMESGVTIVDPSSTWIAPEVKIDMDTTVLPGTYITGAVHIGNNCLIGPNAFIQGAVKIGNHTTVMQSVIVNSSIGSNCRMARLHMCAKKQ